MARNTTHNEKMRYVTFIMTHNCNLNCTYCYEHFKEEESFDIELAKKIVDSEADSVDSYEEICFDFFGGEPFLEFEKIKEIVEYAKSKKYKKKVYFFAGTNGTLINESIQKWLLANRDIFQIALSVDGTKTMHDTNRSGSYDMIPMEFFVNEFRNMSVKATISPETLSDLSQGVMHLHSLGFQNISCNLAVGVDWSSDEYVSILQRELKTLIEFYLDNPDVAPCNLLDYSVEYAAHPTEGKALKFCGAGTRTKVFDVDGREYPCQYFLPLTLGGEPMDLSQVHFEDVMNLSEMDEHCQKCVAVNICPSCYGSNYQETGDIHRRNMDFCKLQKVILLANSYFSAKKWELGRFELDDYKEQELLAGIMQIQKNIKL